MFNALSHWGNANFKNTLKFHLTQLECLSPKQIAAGAVVGLRKGTGVIDTYQTTMEFSVELTSKNRNSPVTWMHAFNSRTQEAEAGRSLSVQSQPGLHSPFQARQSYMVRAVSNQMTPPQSWKQISLGHRARLYTTSACPRRAKFYSTNTGSWTPTALFTMVRKRKQSSYPTNEWKINNLYFHRDYYSAVKKKNCETHR